MTSISLGAMLTHEVQHIVKFSEAIYLLPSGGTCLMNTEAISSAIGCMIGSSSLMLDTANTGLSIFRCFLCCSPVMHLIQYILMRGLMLAVLTTRCYKTFAEHQEVALNESIIDVVRMLVLAEDVLESERIGNIQCF